MAAAAAIGILGSLIGSFLNVVIHRVPVGRSVISPPSSCGSCGHAVRWYDNIPILSWLMLRGRCRDCAAPISVRYPLVELTTAALFVLAALRFLSPVSEADGVAAAVAQVAVLLAFLYLAAISVSLAAIDLDTHRLPNVLVLPAYGVGAALLASAAVLVGAYPALLTAGIGALVMGGFYLALALARPGGMGAGDVKLAGVLGLFLGWLGWPALVVGILAGFILGGLYGVVLILARRATRSTGIPFGPWMLAGAWVGILAGRELAGGYLALFGVGES